VEGERGEWLKGELTVRRKADLCFRDDLQSSRETPVHTAPTSAKLRQTLSSVGVTQIYSTLKMRTA
jgi:hypothetical protein